VQGFVSLLSNGKVDAALKLIYEAAPLAGVLGRVCTHPCEGACKRGDLDDPVFVKALHRYAADNARGDVQYRFKVPAEAKRIRSQSWAAALQVLPLPGSWRGAVFLRSFMSPMQS